MKLSSPPWLLYHPRSWFLLRAVINFPTLSPSHVRAAGRSLPVSGWLGHSLPCDPPRGVVELWRLTLMGPHSGALTWWMPSVQWKIYTFPHVTEQMMWESSSPNTHTHTQAVKCLYQGAACTSDFMHHWLSVQRTKLLFFKNCFTFFFFFCCTLVLSKRHPCV